MAKEDDEKYLNSSLITGFRQIMQDDMQEKKVSKSKYGYDLLYDNQPYFNKIINGKALPGMRALIEITDQLGYDIIFKKREESPKNQDSNDAT